MDIGFIGLGQMGVPMATRLLDAGHRLIVHDLSQDAVGKLVAKGATQAKSPKEVADQVETVFVSLPTPAIVLQVASGESGVVAGSRVKRFVDLSTTGTRMARHVAEVLGARDITAIDAPVSGGIGGARAGTLAIMVACSEAEFATLQPALKVIGKVFHVGAEPGMGQTMKLVNNFLSATALAATGEAMIFGAKAGLDPAVMIDVINAGSGRTTASTDKFPRSILPGTFDFGFTTALMCKDLRLFAEEAEAAGVPQWIGAAVRQMWQFAFNAEGGESDFTTVVKPMERWAGVELRGRRQTGE